MFQIIKNFEIKLPDEATTNDIDDMLLKAIESLIPEDPDFDRIASKQLVKIINKNINTRFSSFAEYIGYGVKEKLLSDKLLEFNCGTLELHINYDYDDELNYFGLATIRDRYLMRDRKKQIIEKPQRMRMRVAMGLSLLEKKQGRICYQNLPENGNTQIPTFDTNTLQLRYTILSTQ